MSLSLGCLSCIITTAAVIGAQVYNGFIKKDLTGVVELSEEPYHEVMQRYSYFLLGISLTFCHFLTLYTAASNTCFSCTTHVSHTLPALPYVHL